jgi:hypothetical protein
MKNHFPYMAKTALVFSALCIVALLLSGCTASSPSPGGTPSTTLPTPPVPITPADNQTCDVDADCVTAPASPAGTSLQLTVTPKKYSPLMSSTVGVGIALNATGFNLADSRVIWNASYGKFLSWGPADFIVHDLGNSTANHGEKLYWSFYEKPAPSREPVIVTVTATDPESGIVMAKGVVTLDWDGELGVIVKDIS